MRVAINGFGRIGRTFTRVIQGQSDIELVAINDLGNVENLAHLLKYDSIHGRFPSSIAVANNRLIIDGKSVAVYSENNPVNLPWKNLNVDLVIESTGLFRKTDEAKRHIEAGARLVIISAPAADSKTKTVVLGVNDNLLDGSELIVSNASCTTNSAAPLIKVLQDNWKIEQAYITTVHSYTSDQRLHDAPHNDWRRGRAGVQSIVPTTTGAAKAITKIFPSLDGKIGGAGIRVPVPNGSLTDLSCFLSEEVSIKDINQAFKTASESSLKGILEYTTDPIVSIDIIDNPHSCVFDSLLTSTLGRMVKVVGWYDNEWGYSNRLLELARKVH
jgi:glyceraldehyde 3-phosphate dehydrogenase